MALHSYRYGSYTLSLSKFFKFNIRRTYRHNLVAILFL